MKLLVSAKIAVSSLLSEKQTAVAYIHHESYKSIVGTIAFYVLKWMNQKYYGGVKLDKINVL